MAEKHTDPQNPQMALKYTSSKYFSQKLNIFETISVNLKHFFQSLSLIVRLTKAEKRIKACM